MTPAARAAPPHTIRLRCPGCRAYLTVSARPGDPLADQCAALFHDAHTHCTPGDPLAARLAAHGDQPEPLFHLETP